MPKVNDITSLKLMVIRSQKSKFMAVFWKFTYGFIGPWYLPIVPKSSTPSAAKMKNKRRKRSPRFPTWGRACATVSSSRRTPFAVLSSLRTRAMRKTRITRIIDMLIGIVTTPKIPTLSGCSSKFCKVTTSDQLPWYDNISILYEPDYSNMLE